MTIKIQQDSIDRKGYYYNNLSNKKGPSWKIVYPFIVAQPNTSGIYTTATEASFNSPAFKHFYFGASPSATVNPSNVNVAWDTTDKLEAFWTMSMTGWGGLSANNMVGMGFWETGATNATTGNATVGKIIVGMAKDGTFGVVCANGSGSSGLISTGFSYTDQSFVEMSLTYVPATSVIVKINQGNTTTVTASIPTQLFSAGPFRGDSGASVVAWSRLYSGYCEITKG